MLIKVDRIEKNVKAKQIICNISTEIHRGDAIGIVGPNGAGKTTFLKLIASVIKPDSGSIYFRGESYQQQVKALRATLGYVPQDIALFEDLTVKEQLQFWRKAAPRTSSKQFVQQVIHLLGLEEVFHKKVKQLSGGWQRKTSLCAGLIHDPDIILLDEPTAGVDLAAKDDLIRLLQSLNKQGKTVILISHEWDVIDRLCKRIFILKEGRLLFDKGIHGLPAFAQTLNEDNGELRKILRQHVLQEKSR
ncbi:ABC transporter ATP-binding protein [Salirhabdus salicampi]|uniref:ABC transporter ATP-binding protein n=1 Tax=Salirhabdus salicampi TaxID=476102 RepID=UPI0020C38840|nr:ABC transporter ATP-binding protein [Salirhabdus salicampi]MCP8615322.1 ABC transporter ATP-binding protein [Salirhabdus salicampi]